MTSGDPIADVIVGLVDELLADGVHLLDPATRATKVREAVEAQRAVWASIDPTTSSQRADAQARAAHVQHAEREARADEPTVELPLPTGAR